VLFNSLEFILFGILFFAGWPLLRRRRNSRWAYLVAASFFFYGWWDWRFLFLIVGSGLIDYFAALGMLRWPRRRKLLLVASVVGNVGSLATFKYLDFFLGNVNGALRLLGIEAPAPLPHMILPVGISFYTFQSMSYTIDVYRGRMRPTRNPLHFFAYLAMFPQLVAGPIVRAAHLLPQLEQAPATDEPARWDGLRLIVYGYFKKAVIADSLARYVNAAFAAAEPVPSCSYWWLIMVLFAFQIYCDFSGYSDIARGLARWMGYDFPRNFDHPYVATSFREFWARWHISLSSWFRDYVYIPLGGSRRGALRAHLNLWITMLVSGLWHGAAWTFAAWGAVHAAYLSLERVTQWPRRLRALPGGRHVAAAIVFVLVVLGWVFFRAQSFGQAWAILQRMFDFAHLEPRVIATNVHVRALILVALAGLRQVYVHLGLGEAKWANRRWAAAGRIVVLAVLLVACIFLRGKGSAFIYFQF
jgi:alginate O-acetyltransferase complex protein AlgI